MELAFTTTTQWAKWGLNLKLLLTLNEFGLNPEDWQFAESENTEKVILIHRLDPHFKLVGHVGDDKWKSLQILSI